MKIITDRIIRDIRFFESKPENYTGEFDGILGNVYQGSSDTKYIGLRIARKLNELGFVSGTFHHFYIRLSPKMLDNEFEISNSEYADWMKTVNFGINPNVFNSFNEFEKDDWIKETTFKALNFVFKEDPGKTKIIAEVETLIDKFDREIEIRFKSKKTKAYEIDVSYQIRPHGDSDKVILRVFNRKDYTNRHGSIDLISLEDIYLLIDTISIKDDYIVMNPRKSYTATLSAKEYDMPLKFKIENLEYEHVK